jgi:hypothetical protein
MGERAVRLAGLAPKKVSPDLLVGSSCFIQHWEKERFVLTTLRRSPLCHKALGGL